MSKHPPLRFDVSEVLFALVFAALFHQANLAPNAFQWAVADVQIELTDQTTSAEGGGASCATRPEEIPGPPQFSEVAVDERGIVPADRKGRTVDNGAVTCGQ